jgi:hypothetical protein
LRTPYERVLKGIEEGTVNPNDFNALFEAMDKSTRERVLRRTRTPKVTPTGRQDFGRIVPKLAGHDDPPRQGRGRRFASGRAPKERQNRDQARVKGNTHQSLDPRLIDKTALEGWGHGWEQADPAAVQFLLAQHGHVLSEHTIAKPVLIEVRVLAARLLRDGPFRAVFENKCQHTVSDGWLYKVVKAADTVLGDVQAHLRFDGLPEAPCSICSAVCYNGCGCTCHRRRVAAFEDGRARLLDQVDQTRSVIGLAEEECPSCGEDWRSYELSFDKAGYVNNLREEMRQRGLREDRDWRYNHNVLWLRTDLQLDEDLMDWLLEVGRAKPHGYDPRSIFR